MRRTFTPQVRPRKMNSRPMDTFTPAADEPEALSKNRPTVPYMVRGSRRRMPAPVWRRPTLPAKYTVSMGIKLRPTLPERRTAQYVCHMTLSDPSGTIRAVSEGTCSGRIVGEPRGTHGFGYDPWFEPEGYHGTFGELGPEE